MRALVMAVRETFAEAQSATIDELERGAVATQADVGQQIMNLLAGEHGGKGVVIFGSDLGKEGPVGVPEEIDEKHAGGGAGLTDGFGCPKLLELYEEEVVAQLRLGDRGRIAAGVLVDEPEAVFARLRNRTLVDSRFEGLNNRKMGAFSGEVWRQNQAHFTALLLHRVVSA